MAIEQVKALSNFYGTSLNSRISGYDRLTDRITWSLGYPLVNVEIHKNQLYEFISIACEMFTKYAGYTEEYLIFDSKIYEQGKGIRLDKLFTHTPDLCATYTSVALNMNIKNPKTLTTTVTAGEGYQDIYTFDLSDGVLDPTEFSLRVIDTDSNNEDVRKMLVTANHDADAGTTDGSWDEWSHIYTGTGSLGDFNLSLSGSNEEIVQIQFQPDAGQVATTAKVVVFATDQLTTSTVTSLSSLAFGAYDALVNDYRKVIEVFSWEEGSTSGVNTLFTIEQTLAQQTYFSYAMGQYGFDLVSWYTVKEWLDLREKLLSQKRSFVFNPLTQYLRMYPEPASERFYGIFGCYLEKRIEDILHEPWVLQYATALTKIAVGRVRSKYSNTNLFGGGSLETEILSEGKEEKDKLEAELLEGTPGFGDAGPPMFFIG